MEPDDDQEFPGRGHLHLDRSRKFWSRSGACGPRVPLLLRPLPQKLLFSSKFSLLFKHNISISATPFSTFIRAYTLAPRWNRTATTDWWADHEIHQVISIVSLQAVVADRLRVDELAGGELLLPLLFLFCSLMETSIQKIAAEKERAGIAEEIQDAGILKADRQKRIHSSQDRRDDDPRLGNGRTERRTPTPTMVRS